MPDSPGEFCSSSWEWPIPFVHRLDYWQEIAKYLGREVRTVQRWEREKKLPVRRLSGEESLAFFDAIAPIVHHDSIDQSIAWKQSRYDKGGTDYFNCPLVLTNKLDVELKFGEKYPPLFTETTALTTRQAVDPLPQ